MAVRDSHGRLMEVQSVGRDITQRKNLEDALTEARDKAESLEVKARLRRILGAWATAERRSANAIEVLEMVGTPEAERMLKSLDATDAVARLRKRR